MKKLYSAIFVATLSLALAACAGGESEAERLPQEAIEPGAVAENQIDPTSPAGTIAVPEAPVAEPSPTPEPRESIPNPTPEPISTPRPIVVATPMVTETPELTPQETPDPTPAPPVAPTPEPTPEPITEPTPTPEPTPYFGAWQFAASIDPIDSEVLRIAFSTGSWAGTVDWTANEYPELILACATGERLRVALITGGYVAEQYRVGGIPVEYSFSGEDVTRENWNESTSNESVIVPEWRVDGFLDLLREHSTSVMAIRIANFDQDTFGTAFLRLNGVEAAIDKMKADCGP